MQKQLNGIAEETISEDEDDIHNMDEIVIGPEIQTQLCEPGLFTETKFSF